MISNQEIFRLLDDNKVVSSYEILDFRKKQLGFYLKLQIIFNDQSILFAREYFDINIRNYSYHWQDKNDLLIMRWDNAPYHPNIETFPHHKHKDNSIQPSTEIALEQALNFIAGIIKGK